MANLAGEHKPHLRFFGMLLIAFLGAFIYSNILHAQFIFDDYSSIVDNDAIKNFTISLKDISNNRYLSLLSFTMNYAIGDLKPVGYHIINNFIHIINAILVYCVLILTFKTPYFSSQQSAIHRFTDSPLFIAFSTAFIFVSHPVQTQAVTYIAQRATSMATMFYLFSLVMYIKWRLRQLEDRSQKHGLYATRYMLYAISLISAIFAMKTKEIAFTLPVVIAFYEFSFFNKTSAPQYVVSKLKRFLYLLPILLTLLIIPLSMLNFKAPVETITQDIDIQSRETANITRTDYLLTQFRVVVTYLRLLILPLNQNLDYRFSVYHSFFDLQVFLSFLFLMSIVVFAVYLFYTSRFKHKGLRLMAFGIFWFFITLSVESSFIPIRDVVVEHRLYLPSIGFFIAAVLSVDHLFSNMRLKIALMAAIVLMLSVGTYNRNTIWKDPQTLWEDVIFKSPNNVRAYTELGAIFRDEGRYAEANELFNKALKINSNYALTYYNIGYVHYKNKNYKNALMYFRKTLEFNLPSLIRMEVFNSSGMAYSEMGNDIEAVNAFKEAIKTLPTSIIPYNNLGRQYIKMGSFDSAIEIFKKGLEVREEPLLRSNLAIAYSAKEHRRKNAGQTKK